MDVLDLVAHLKAGEGTQNIVRQPRQLIEDSSRDIVFLFLDTVHHQHALTIQQEGFSLLTMPPFVSDSGLGIKLHLSEPRVQG